MDTDTSDLLPISDESKFLNQPHKERWEKLRPIIVPLYMTKKGPEGKSLTITQVSAFMKTHYRFHAAESEYKNWFRKWGVRKRILTSEKNAIVSILGKRTYPGTSTSDITLGENKKVEKKQLRRYLSDQVRVAAQNHLERVPGVLLSYNLPYAAYIRASGLSSSNHSSPFTALGASPTYLTVHSPKDPRSPGEPAAPASPTMQLVREKLALDRASLFLQGRTKELLGTCGKEDRITLVNYFNDLNLYTFITTKYWGKGPRPWTAELVAALTSGSIENAAPLPPISDESSPGALIPEPEIPTQLCNWVVHILGDGVDTKEPEESDEERYFEIDKPRTWKNWPKDVAAGGAEAFARTFSKSIEEGAFSLASPDDLPLSLKAITQSVLQDSELLVVDACKAAIMAGNGTLVSSLCKEARKGFGYDLSAKIYSIHPFHLAAAYIDGGRSCCLVMESILVALGPGSLLRYNVNDLGHTVLDSLMVSILRSHTKISPDLVSRNFDPPDRFPGEEKCICGRWDADSPAVRQLFAQGFPRIPSSWKHMFCHTSVQAICHNVISLFGSPAIRLINADSGLFTRRCVECGLELRLGPLHTLVVVTFYLASRGMPGETLFGALALLVCLLSLGADPYLTKQISVGEILGNLPQDTCTHEPMNALDLMQAVPGDFVSGWTVECQTGWRCMLEVFCLAMGAGSDSTGDSRAPHELRGSIAEDHDWRRRQNYTSYSTCSLETRFGLHSGWLGLPCLDPKLGTVWAIIQTEFLTYRRIEAEDPWTSERFSMDALKDWLAGDVEELDMALMHGMVNTRSSCGWFESPSKTTGVIELTKHLSLFPCVEEVCKFPFTNMLGKEAETRGMYIVDYDSEGDSDSDDSDSDGYESVDESDEDDM
ncbi:hypothetical protein V8F20_006135 [Naviculisporaceae sp. PSN 640]